MQLQLGVESPQVGFQHASEAIPGEGLLSPAQWKQVSRLLANVRWERPE